MARRVSTIMEASRGIGAEIARAALSARDSVVATARDRQAMGDLGGAGDEMMALRMDVTDEGEVSAGVADAIARFGRIGVLVNNA
jgi:NAD(P)-dependent dehydrogenase (short-subunit alcohol dehydrogenase family)